MSHFKSYGEFHQLFEDSTSDEMVKLTQDIIADYKEKYPRSQNHLERFAKMAMDLVMGRVEKIKRWDFGIPNRTSGQWGVDFIRDLEKAGVIEMFKISRTMYEKPVTPDEWIRRRGSRVAKQLSII